MKAIISAVAGLGLGGAAAKLAHPSGYPTGYWHTKRGTGSLTLRTECGVAEQGGKDQVPGRGWRRPVADAVEQEQLGARDLVRQGEAVSGREERVLGAVDDERRRSHVAQPELPVLAVLAGREDPVVLRARLQVDRAIDRPTGDLANACFVE